MALIYVIHKSYPDLLLTSSQLRISGYPVVAFEDPIDGFEQIKNNPPDLLVTDFMTADMSGLVRMIKSDDQVPYFPILMLSSNDNRDNALDSGADDFLLRPYIREELLDHVTVLLLGLTPLSQVEFVKAFIYVIDDDTGDLLLIGSWLRIAGYSVVAFEDPIDGFEQIKNNPPDLLVVDLVMPRLTGDELVRMIRSDDAIPYFPILMQSGGTKWYDRDDALNGGVNDYLLKPLSQKDFLRRVLFLLRTIEYPLLDTGL